MRIVVAATALALMSGVSLAQTPPAPPTEQGTDRPKPPPMDDRDDDAGRGGMRPHHPPSPKGARIRVEAGDISIGIRCPEDEGLKACADFTLQLIDKLGNLPRR